MKTFKEFLEAYGAKESPEMAAARAKQMKRFTPSAIKKGESIWMSYKPSGRPMMTDTLERAGFKSTGKISKDGSFNYEEMKATKNVSLKDMTTLMDKSKRAFEPLSFVAP